MIVEDVLAERSRDGFSTGYEELIKALTDSTLSDEILLSYIQGLRSCILKLSKVHENLVGAILSVDWFGRDVVADSYVMFLGELLTAHSGYLQAALRVVVSSFAPSSKQLIKDEHSTMGSYQSQFDNVHKAARGILTAIPLSGPIFIEIVAKLFPYHGKPTIILQCFVRNLLQVTVYAPSIRQRLLEIIIDKLLKIDVEIPKHALESIADNEFACQFDVDVDDVSSKMKDSAEKLDVLLLLMCEFLRRTCYRSDKEVDWKMAMLLNREMATCFEKFLLPTHACSYVQFIYFHLCSFNEVFSNFYLELMWKAVQDPNLPSVLRQSAAAYLGSLVSRARFITTEMVRQMLVAMRDWISRYIGLQDGGSLQADLSRHAAFYSVCQSMMYVFVFRHNALLSEPNGMAFCQSLNFEKMVSSQLNPLKFCLRTIVEMFARLTRMHEIVFCYTIIDRNSRCQLPIAHGRNEIKDIARYRNILETFFPFDPCLLPRMSKLVACQYKEWEESSAETSCQLDYDSEEDVYDNTIQCAEEKETSLMYMACSPTWGACISPGFQMAYSLKSNEM